MGARFPFVSSGVQVNPLPASAAETVICTTPPISPSFDFGPLVIRAFLDITAGANTTAIALAIRRGTTVAGALVLGPGVLHTLAAGNSAMLQIDNVDTTGPLGAQQYSLTIIQTGATVAGAVNALLLYVFGL